MLEINAATKSLLEDEVNHFLVIDQYFIVDTNFIEERSSSHSFVEMRQYIRDIFHKEMFCFHVIEAKESEILIDREEQRSMGLRQRLITNDLDVFNQRIINTFGHIELLEEIVIFFSLVVELIDDISVENVLINVHQTFYVFEANVIFQGSGQEEEILDNT